MVKTMDFLKTSKDGLINVALFVLLSTEAASNLVKTTVSYFAKDSTSIFPASEPDKTRMQLIIVKGILLLILTMLIRRFMN
ncbi:hypothetical protein [Trichoplusia ni ascovirus 6b]|nr:hypothetical protein [Trichoplusia ni ascovirus 6b]